MTEEPSRNHVKPLPVSIAELRAWVAALDTQMDLDRLHDGTPFRQAGADSFDLFTIAIGLQDLFGVTVPDEDIVKISSLDAIARYLNERSR